MRRAGKKERRRSRGAEYVQGKRNGEGRRKGRRDRGRVGVEKCGRGKLRAGRKGREGGG